MPSVEAPDCCHVALGRAPNGNMKSVIRKTSRLQKHQVCQMKPTSESKPPVCNLGRRSSEGATCSLGQVSPSLRAMGRASLDPVVVTLTSASPLPLSKAPRSQEQLWGHLGESSLSLVHR
jgi:hypothetical protein